MRKVILYVNVTLDGFIAGPAGELDWMLPDPAMNIELSNEMRAEVDTILEGRQIHEAFEQNFRHEASDPGSPPELVDFAQWMLDTPKVVFSRTATALEDPKVRVAQDIPSTVAELKAESGKAMVLFGGVKTVQQFVQQGLVDEYWIKLYPVALGAGQPLFTDLSHRADLRLTHCKAYDSGIVVQRYENAAS